MGSKESAIMSKTVGGKVIFRVHYDMDPRNPREEEPFISIVGWHRKYHVSDRDMLEFRDRDAFLASVRPEDIVRPLYMYEHGAVALSTTPYSDKWDSRQLGYVLVTPERLERIGLKSSDTEMIERNVDAELKEFQAYMNGEIYQIDAHRMVDGDVLETVVGTIGDIWDTKDDTLDEAVSALLHDLDPQYTEGITDDAVVASEWQ